MLKNISLGIYYPGNSILHHLQARTKLLLVLILMLALLFGERSYWDFTPYFAALGLVVIGIFCSGISWREIGRRLWLLVLIVALTTSLVFFTPVGLTGFGRVLYVFPPLLLTPGFFLGLGIVLFLLVNIHALLARLSLPTQYRATFRRWLRRARTVTLIAVGVFCFILVYAYFAQPSQATPSVAYMLTSDGVWYSGVFFLIFLALYPSSLLLTMTTSPVALIEGLTMLLAPLRWFRLPVDDFALMTLVALRFIPTLLEEFELLMKAQAARGANFNSGTLRERLHSVQALFVPFMRNTLRRASDLATALDARGYQVDGRQTRMHEKAFALSDYLALLIMIGVLAVALFI